MDAKSDEKRKDASSGKHRTRKDRKSLKRERKEKAKDSTKDEEVLSEEEKKSESSSSRDASPREKSPKREKPPENVASESNDKGKATVVEPLSAAAADADQQRPNKPVKSLSGKDRRALLQAAGKVVELERNESNQLPRKQTSDRSLDSSSSSSAASSDSSKRSKTVNESSTASTTTPSASASPATQMSSDRNRAKTDTVPNIAKPGEEKAIVPIMLSITLPAELGGATHPLVLHENLSLDHVKAALWKQVPDLWDGPQQHDYNFFIKKTKENLDVEFKKLLSFDSVAQLYEARKRIKLQLITKKTVIIQPKQSIQTKRDAENANSSSSKNNNNNNNANKTPWKIEADKLAAKLAEAEEKLYRMEKRLKDWRSSVDDDLREGVYPPPSNEKKMILQHVRQQIDKILIGKVDQGEETDEESDEEFEVADGEMFLPRRLASSIFEHFGGAGHVTIDGGGQRRLAKEDHSKKLTPEQHLERIREEIIETEVKYVEGLDVLINIYLKKIEEQAIMTPKDVELIFSNIRQLHQIHHQLKEDLQKSVDVRSLSGAFRAFVPYLKMYTEYVNGFDKATERIDKLEKDKRVKALLDECKNLPECAKLDLRAFLITPIQRLPRYELLLRDLLKHVPEANKTEKEEIQKLFSLVVDVNKHVNESKRQQERRQRLYKLKNAAKPKGLDIFSRPDRQLVKEDTLPSHEIDPSLDRAARRALNLGALKFRQRYFFLFDDLFLEVRELKSGKYKFVRSFDLLHLQVRETLEDENEDDEENEGNENNSDNKAEESDKKASDENGQSENDDTEDGEKDKGNSSRSSSIIKGSEIRSMFTFVLREEVVGAVGPDGVTAREWVIKAGSVEAKQSWVQEIRKACAFAKNALGGGGGSSDAEGSASGGFKGARTLSSRLDASNSGSSSDGKSAVARRASSPDASSASLVDPAKKKATLFSRIKSEGAEQLSKKRDKKKEKEKKKEERKKKKGK